MVSLTVAGCSSTPTQKEKPLPAKQERCVTREEANLEQRIVRISNREESIFSSRAGWGYILDQDNILTTGHQAKGKRLTQFSIQNSKRNIFQIERITLDLQYDIAVLKYTPYKKVNTPKIPSIKTKENLPLFYLKPAIGTSSPKEEYQQISKDIKKVSKLNLDFTYEENNAIVRGKLKDGIEKIVEILDDWKDKRNTPLYETTLFASESDSGMPVFTEKNGCVYLVGMIVGGKTVAIYKGYGLTRGIGNAGIVSAKHLPKN